MFGSTSANIQIGNNQQHTKSLSWIIISFDENIEKCVWNANCGVDIVDHAWKLHNGTYRDQTSLL